MKMGLIIVSLVFSSKYFGRDTECLTHWNLINKLKGLGITKTKMYRLSELMEYINTCRNLLYWLYLRETFEIIRYVLFPMV